jgi:hypothetical protein
MFRKVKTKVLCSSHVLHSKKCNRHTRGAPSAAAAAGMGDVDGKGAGELQGAAGRHDVNFREVSVEKMPPPNKRKTLTTTTKSWFKRLLRHGMLCFLNEDSVLFMHPRKSCGWSRRDSIDRRVRDSSHSTHLSGPRPYEEILIKTSTKPRRNAVMPDVRAAVANRGEQPQPHTPPEEELISCCACGRLSLG